MAAIAIALYMILNLLALGVSAGAVFAAVTWLGLGVRGFGMLNTLFVAVWLAIAFQLLKEHRRLAVESDVRPAH